MNDYIVDRLARSHRDDLMDEALHEELVAKARQARKQESGGHVRQGRLSPFAHLHAPHGRMHRPHLSLGHHS
jgi:hypothetical protein